MGVARRLVALGIIAGVLACGRFGTSIRRMAAPTPAHWKEVSFTFEPQTFHLRYGATEPVYGDAPWDVTVIFGVFTNETTGATIEYDDIVCDRP